MRVHEYTRHTGERVEFHRDVASRDLRVIVIPPGGTRDDGDEKPVVKLTGSAPLSDFESWDTLAYQEARRWQKVHEASTSKKPRKRS